MRTEERVPLQRDGEIERAVVRRVDIGAAEDVVRPTCAAMKADPRTVRVGKNRKFQTETGLQSWCRSKFAAGRLRKKRAELEAERVDQQIESIDAELVTLQPTRREERTN